jgi:hypothetical protein
VNLHVPGNQMPAKDLRIAELHPAYRSVSHEEAVEMANLGAAAYEIVKDSLRTQWTSAMSAEDAAKADIWRSEGRMSALEEFKAKIKEAESIAVRLAAAEAANEQLQKRMEKEISVRVSDQLESFRKDYEISSKDIIHKLELQLAEATVREQMSGSLEKSNETLTEYVSQLQAELAKFKATKSSHAIGKIGEAAIFDMLNTYVLPCFPFSEVKDMTAVKHKGDFHIWMYGPAGKQVKIMLDVKKYASPVQTVEVEKLFSDLDGDDAHIGIMVSLDSPIANKAQFQIVKTKRDKPCMFLTFDKLDDGIRQEVLCWAFRALICAITPSDTTTQAEKFEELQAFVADMNVYVGDIDGCMKVAKSLHDSLRDMKDRLIGRIAAFKGEPIVTVSDEMRCKAMLASGGQCKARSAQPGSNCSRHKPKVTVSTAE